MKRYKIFTAFITVALVIGSCTKDLNTTPNDPNVITSSTVYNDTAAYKESLARIYGSLTLTGLGTNSTDGAVGNPDIVTDDEGKASYLRLYWCAQELTTDEAVNGWNDQDINELHSQSWSSSNSFLGYMYTRIYYNVALCNEYIRDVGARVDGLDGTLKENVKKYLAEVRFMRSLSYSHALDMYTDVPFVTEDDPVGAYFPDPISRTDLFNYVEQELKALSPLMAAPRTNEYARADRAAVWMLLARIYLNSEVYTGQKRYNECIAYCDSIIGAGYSLHPNYEELFLADNNITSTDEIIFPVAHDGLHTQTYGGMTFIIDAAIGGSMNAADYGASTWGGNRVTKALVETFPSLPTNDSRAMFYTDGQNLEIDNIGTFTDGYAVTKFKNITSQGDPGSNGTFADTDYPLFRLADVYLMYAEAVLRGGTGGSLVTALGYINDLRERAYGDNTGDITQDELTLDFILNERARELYWEGSRRTDLIRFGKFTGGNYLWPWKGGVKNGVTTDEKYNIFPIPASDLAANPNLTPTKGY